MTLLPHDNRLLVARLDLEPYELPGVCQWPDCDETHGLEDHHLWRRSFGKDFREAWWVEFPNSMVFPNRVHLCPAHHLVVTNNEVRIRLIMKVDANEQNVSLFSVFGWEDKTEGDYLGDLEPPAGPQGGASGRTPGGTSAEGRSAMQLTVDGEEKPHDEVCEEHGEDETCPSCKGTGKRKRKKRKATKGTGKTQVIAIRIPASEEGGFERLSALHDAAEAILVEQGILRERANGAAFYRDSAIYAQFVNEHRELLPEDWKKGEFDIEEREDA